MQSIRYTVVLLFFLQSAHALEWTKATPLPESQAIVKSLEEIKKTTVQEKIPPVSIDTSLFPNFTAATYNDSGVVPPDAMGVVGPQQFILAANGRIRSFNKKSGKPDLAIDISTDDFFKPVSKGSFTTDSQIRYDSFSKRWFILITAATVSPIRIVLAMSDGEVITPKTKWSFFYFEPRSDKTPDYPSLGIDKQALYIGVNVFNKKGYDTSDAYVISKADLIKGTFRAFAFRDLVVQDKFIGPLSPVGVDNFDSDATEGYIIGMDGRHDRLMLRRIKDLGGVPSISENIAISILPATFPLNVPQKGSIGSNKFFLQGFDTRLTTTHVRDKLIYTAFNVSVNNKGVGDLSSATRDGCRWYEIDLKDPDHPAIVQTGTLFQPSRKNDFEERYYWMPGMMTNGLHTIVISCSTAGNQDFANAAFAMRFSDDPSGTLRAPRNYTNSNVIYQLGLPPFKDLRWGEYSYTSVDPLDNMTFWAIAEFALAPTSWGLQVVRIPAPPPAEIVAVSPSTLTEHQAGVNLSIMGERVNGSAFYDPGESFPNRLRVLIEDVEVTSVKWISPSRIDLVVNTGASAPNPLKAIKITNPDSQVAEANGLLKVVPK